MEFTFKQGLNVGNQPYPSEMDNAELRFTNITKLYMFKLIKFTHCRLITSLIAL